MKQLHFLGGFPRSGSTLLASLLQQNPSVYATGTDPFPYILHKHILTEARYTEAVQAMSTFQSDLAFHGLAVRGAQGWYESLTTRDVVVSKSRNWGDVWNLFPNSKMIFMLRDLRDIVESFNRVNTRQRALGSVSDSKKLYNAMSEEEKYRYYFDNTTNSFGYAMFHELPKWQFLEQEGKSVLWLRYEDLIRYPHETMDRVWKFLEVEPIRCSTHKIEPLHWEEWDNAYFNEKTSHELLPMLREVNPRRDMSERLHTRIREEYAHFYERYYPDEQTNSNYRYT